MYNKCYSFLVLNYLDTFKANTYPPMEKAS